MNITSTAINNVIRQIPYILINTPNIFKDDYSNELVSLLKAS